jgi:hypothetical protein
VHKLVDKHSFVAVDAAAYQPHEVPMLKLCYQFHLVLEFPNPLYRFLRQPLYRYFLSFPKICLLNKFAVWLKSTTTSVKYNFFMTVIALLSYHINGAKSTLSYLTVHGEVVCCGQNHIQVEQRKVDILLAIYLVLCLPLAPAACAWCRFSLNFLPFPVPPKTAAANCPQKKHAGNTGDDGDQQLRLWTPAGSS